MLLRVVQLCFAFCRYSPILIASIFSRSAARFIGRYLSGVLGSAGGALPKFGQVLSTRPDLIPEEICRELAKLQDQMPPVPAGAIHSLLEANGTARRLEHFESHPVASASIAQVHRAASGEDGREVALKIRRPEVKARIEQDCLLAQAVSKLIEKLPLVSSVPVRQAVDQACVSLRAQTNFRREAANLARLRRDLAGEFPRIIVPSLVPALCSGDVVAMEYIGGLRKLIDPAIPDPQARHLTLLGLRALFHMIFETGFIHCDLHPGNLMVNPDGRLVILDAGLMVELDEATRLLFAEFFAAIGLRNGQRAAEIVRDTAEFLPDDFNRAAFDAEVTSLIHETAGLNALQFEITRFVMDLFTIQSRHGMRGTSRFAPIILAMLVYEGVAKQRYPDVDFQREAIPFVVGAVFGIRPKRSVAVTA